MYVSYFRLVQTGFVGVAAKATALGQECMQMLVGRVERLRLRVRAKPTEEWFSGWGWLHWVAVKGLETCQGTCRADWWGDCNWFRRHIDAIL